MKSQPEGHEKMPKYTVHVLADHTGTAYSHECEAATPWLALERSQARLGWMCAELFERGKPIVRVDHLPLKKKGIWQISAPQIEAT